MRFSTKQSDYQQVTPAMRHHPNQRAADLALLGRLVVDDAISTRKYAGVAQGN